MNLDSETGERIVENEYPTIILFYNKNSTSKTNQHVVNDYENLKYKFKNKILQVKCNFDEIDKSLTNDMDFLNENLFPNLLILEFTKDKIIYYLYKNNQTSTIQNNKEVQEDDIYKFFLDW